MTKGLLLELVELRNRVGLSLAFLENTAMLQALAVARTRRGVMGRLREAARDELSEVKRSSGVPMLGPRGGLPRSKAELQQLATSLGIDTSGTVEQLKSRIRETIPTKAELGVKVVAGKPDVPGGGSPQSSGSAPAAASTPASLGGAATIDLPVRPAPEVLQYLSMLLQNPHVISQQLAAPGSGMTAASPPPTVSSEWGHIPDETELFNMAVDDVMNASVPGA